MRLKSAEFKILQYLRDTPIFPERQGVIHLMLSGGKDSVALLEILHQIQRLDSSWSGIEIQLYLHHFNHKQRGSESDEDEILCLGHAKKLGHPIHFYSWNIELDEQVKGGANFQAIARDWRYNSVQNFAEELERRSGNSNWVIATAHHRRDQAETILQNVTRGCGLSGLKGITPWSQSNRLLRPLLCLPVEMLDNYLEQKTLSHREDSSNNKLDYTRNVVRHKILKELEQLNPKAIENIWALSQDVRQTLCISDQTSAFSPRSPDEQPQWKNKIETASFRSVSEVHAFIAAATPKGHPSLTRQNLANILAHMHKLTANPNPKDSYIFALSSIYSLKVDFKYSEIIEM